MSARGRNSKPQPKGGRGRPAKNTAKRRGKGQGKGQPNQPRRGDGQRGTTPIRMPDEGRGGGHLGGDQVEGRHAVRELLMAGTRRTREVIFAGDLDPAPILDDIIDLADEQKVTIREIARSKFESMTRTDGAQGVLATFQRNAGVQNKASEGKVCAYAVLAVGVLISKNVLRELKLRYLFALFDFDQSGALSLPEFVACLWLDTVKAFFPLIVESMAAAGPTSAYK